MQKQQQIITALLLTALFLLQGHAQLCNLGSTSSSADLLQSGSTTIYNSYSNNPTKREHTYTFSLSFTVPPTATLQIAACITSITQPPHPCRSAPVTASTSQFGEAKAQPKSPF